MPRGWLPAGLAIALFACAGDGPCATPGAERKEGVCDCPEGTHLAPVAGHSQCLADQPSSDPAGARDTGVASRDAAPDSAVADTSTPPDSADAEVSDSAVADANVVADAQAADTGPTCVPTTEVCDGTDNDCDTQIDEGVQNACGTCTPLEHPVGDACTNGGQGACARPGKYSCFNGTTVCDAPPPTPKPEECNGVDDDCTGGVDNGLTNICGGTTCAAKLEDKDKPCTAGTGDCQATGLWECDGAAANTLRCTAKEKPKNACGTSCGPVPAENCSTPGDDNCNGQANEGCCTVSAEVCDGKDNDCDGETDEAGALDAPLWYQDCDGDGYSPTTIGALPSCNAPKAGCGWTRMRPDEANKSGWDCNDGFKEYHPGADFGLRPAGQASFDLNCDGSIEGSELPPANPKVCSQPFIAWLHRRQPCLGADCDKYLVEDRCYGFDWLRPPSVDDVTVIYHVPGLFTCPDAAMTIIIACYTNAGVKTCSPAPLASYETIWPCR